MKAFVKDFTHDIFISYAHADNLKFSGQVSGWVDQFYSDLSGQLQRLLGPPVNIWWDKRVIDGTQVFNDTIAAGIKKSAVLICLTSKSYMASTYCKESVKTIRTGASLLSKV